MKLFKTKSILLSLFLLSFAILGFSTNEQSSNEKATEYLNYFLLGNYEKACEFHDATLKNAFPATVMANAAANIEFQFGKYAGNMEIIKENTVQGNNVYLIEAEYKDLYLNYTVSVNPDGEIAGFFFKQGKIKESGIPQYLDENNVIEKDIIIGEAPFELKGTLTTPKGLKEYPVVIISQGSGAHDKDGTIGPNSIYRDIALGLGNIGVACVRYEKRTYAYPGPIAEIKPTEDATYIQYEYTDDIYHALDFCDTIEGNTGTILLGHSQGGAIVPNIAKEDPRVKKLILLAAGIRRFAQISIDQNLYVASITELSEQQKQALEQALVFFKMVLEHKIPAETQIQPGLYVAYMYDFDKYEPMPVLKNLNIPILVVQGEKDFQATMEGDFLPMKNELGDRENFTFVSLPDLDHIFKPIEGEMADLNSINEKGFPEKVLFDTIKEWIFE